MATAGCLGWQATACRGSLSACSRIWEVFFCAFTCTMVEVTVDTTKFLQKKRSSWVIYHNSWHNEDTEDIIDCIFSTWWLMVFPLDCNPSGIPLHFLWKRKWKRLHPDWIECRKWECWMIHHKTWYGLECHQLRDGCDVKQREIRDQYTQYMPLLFNSNNEYFWHWLPVSYSENSDWIFLKVKGPYLIFAGRLFCSKAFQHFPHHKFACCSCC